MHEEKSEPRKPSRRRAAIAAAVGVTALSGAITAGVLVGGQSESGPVGKVSAVSDQQAPAVLGGAAAGTGAESGTGAASGTEAASGAGSAGATGSAGTKTTAGAKAKEKCNTVDRYINSNTIPTNYQWHSSVKYCWNGKKVRIIRASSYLKKAGFNVREEPKPNRIIFNKKHSAVTVMISADVIRPNAWTDVIRHPKVQYRMWAINGAHTYKIIDNEA